MGYLLGNVKKGWTCFSLSAKLLCSTACHETFTNIIYYVSLSSTLKQQTYGMLETTLSMFVITTIIKGKINQN